ncbi:ATP-binding cassette domain-containing protein [Collinsella sp. AM17-1]|uniref:ATP-binding cassette domain-containing protein n=1 Tax=Collinsella sp. AM17-1 TaxID=2292027 RepID=UPI000E512145|nr:ATP-binding cassette domain-containing protein [Collinsella sp. AM17-1]RHH73578.1 ATP-binding cassette domain-containing protein [Collinsella sp. AM17-1]
MEKLIIRDAYEHNLKHIDLDIPLDSFTCVTGCSGCGKSSLVFDTIYAESQRGFLEGMTGNLYGQKLMSKPKVGSIENLHPALNVSQNYYNVNPRSTVGTVTEIAYYLRSVFSIVNSDKSQDVTESTFSSNNPKSVCPNCSGLGIERAVSESLLIPDREVTLRDGGILFFKGSPESKEQKYLEALCEHYGIDIEKKVSELSERELDLLLRADEGIRYQLSYKEGKRRKRHYVHLEGAIPAIMKRMSDCESSSERLSTFGRFTEERPCSACGGAKLRPDVLAYKVDGVNYAAAEHMELTLLRSWLCEIGDLRASTPHGDAIAQLVDGAVRKLDALIKLNVGYLFLARTVPSLSDGERQRVRIATQLTCSLRGLLYILDEPCKGLHSRDIGRITQATKELVDRGNTVIAIEHNKQYISSADGIIELGPVGGPEGGYLMDRAPRPDKGQPLSFKIPFEAGRFFEIGGISFRNIKGQTVRFPVGGITCITGVSGSGKSTLAQAIAKCFASIDGGCCEYFHGRDSVKRVIQVNQAPVGKTPRSTVVSYLGIFDDMRSLFAKTDSAKKLKLGASQFSMNVKGGRCECCQGTGLQKIELNYLPSSYITCPECGGKRFSDKVLSVAYRGMTILDALETPVADMVDVFSDSKKISSVLASMMKLGLGYLKLGQMSMSLSGGEAQRIKLARALGVPSHGKNLYILDEPTSGLSDTDIERFVKVLFSLQEKGDTILIIEHNVEFIAAVSDYIVDFGLASGGAGGTIVSQGLPAAVFADALSSLYGLDDAI